MQTVINSDQFIPHTLSLDVAKWAGNSTPDVGPHRRGQFPLANVRSLSPARRAYRQFLLHLPCRGREIETLKAVPGSQGNNQFANGEPS